MPVNNEIYNATDDIWWDDTRPLAFLRIAMNPARFGYFRDVLLGRVGIGPAGKEALDIGCGGGFLAEEFARLGCRVTGIDPSGPSLHTARSHATASNLNITYLQATGENLPFGDERFEIVYCCDVLEHVDDLDRVMAETARVLKPGGIYFYDTINRTLLSNLILVKAAQEWQLTRVTPQHLHDWKMFIKPAELRVVLARHGLEHREMIGMRPALEPLSLVATLLRYRKGRISYAELASRLQFKESRITSLSYMGYATKPEFQ